MASSLDLTDRGELRLLADLVNAIRSTRPDARFLLVGAMARDVLLWFAHGIPAQRATEDLDFAFAVPDWRSFESLRGALIASDLFEDVPGVVHRVFFAGHRVDLIPFGGVENPVGTIDWPAPQNTRMVVLGLFGADARKLLLPVDGGHSAALAHAMTLLIGDGADGPVRLAADMDTNDLQHAIDMLRAFRAGLNGALNVDGS